MLPPGVAAPLAPATISDIRLACLQTSDAALFQALRGAPAFAPVPGTDALLLGANVPPDGVRGPKEGVNGVLAYGEAGAPPANGEPGKGDAGTLPPP